MVNQIHRFACGPLYATQHYDPYNITGLVTENFLFNFIWGGPHPLSRIHFIHRTTTTTTTLLCSTEATSYIVNNKIHYGFFYENAVLISFIITVTHIKKDVVV